MPRHFQGYSLVETLVSMAIIATLMAMLLPALVRAKHKAEQVGVISSMRQDYIGTHSTGHGMKPHLVSETGNFRDRCRQAYRQPMSDGSGRGEVYVTEMRLVVQNEAEFRAYWHTLINPETVAPLEFTSNGELIAKDEQGNSFHLPFPRDNNRLLWEFLSTVPAETSSGSRGTLVRYGDGHVEYKTYPSGFPACRTVAELSHQFMKTGPEN